MKLSDAERRARLEALGVQPMAFWCWTDADIVRGERKARAKAKADLAKRQAEISPLALWTLKLAVEEHVRPSYLVELRKCVDAGLVIFLNEGKGKPMLTDAGREALKRIA